MGTIDSLVRSFEGRVKDLEGLNGLRLEREKVIKEIQSSKEEAVESARKNIEDYMVLEMNALVEEIGALQKGAIENIGDAQSSAIKEIERATTQADVTSRSEKPDSLLPSPVREFERELKALFTNVQDTQEFRLVVGRDRTYSVDRTDLIFRSVVLQENSTLIVPSTFDKITLRTMKLVTEKGARILARGDRGIDGTKGPSGKNGSTCEHGDDGQNGGPGQRGKNGTTVEIFAIDVVLASSVVVDTSGGNGGNGGQGGNGGNGGQASRAHGCGGGDGGTGGDGGSAGDGGNSGALSIHYVRAYSPRQEDEVVSVPIVKALVKHIATPGTAGLPGYGGIGAFGAAGMASQSLPGGDDGIDGNSGQSGRPGTRGSTIIVQGPAR